MSRHTGLSRTHTSLVPDLRTRFCKHSQTSEAKDVLKQIDGPETLRSIGDKIDPLLRSAITIVHWLHQMTIADNTKRDVHLLHITRQLTRPADVHRYTISTAGNTKGMDVGGIAEEEVETSSGHQRLKLAVCTQLANRTSTLEKIHLQ